MPARPTLFRAIAFAAASLVLAATSIVSRAAATFPQHDIQRAREIQRLEDLARIWIYVDLFDPYLSANGAEWDQALIETIPAVRSAQDDKTFVAAINAMLKKSGDPAARVIAPPPSPPAQPAPPLAQVKGTWIANCTAMAHAVTTGAAPVQLAENIAARPTVVDCRAFAGDAKALKNVIAAIARTRTPVPLPAGSSLVRSYSGFPSEVGTSSGGFAAGFSIVSKGAIAAGKAAPAKTPLVFLLDGETSAPVLPSIAALQTAGQLRVVAQGPVGSDVATLRLPRLSFQISEGLYTYPAGAVGFRPDVIAPPKTALATAIAQLAASPAAVLREPSLPQLRRPPRRYKDAGAPSSEQRLLALFRVWGTINYFQPYKALMDRPWDPVLGEFIPAMLAADSRTAYETALLRLAARTQDAHSRIDGMTAPPFGYGTNQPPFRAHFVENKLVVAALYGQPGDTKLQVGDEILSIDGIGIKALEQRLTPFVPASTPQGFRTVAANRMLSGAPASMAVLVVRNAKGTLRQVRVPRTLVKPPESTAQAWRLLSGNVGYIDLEHLTLKDAPRALEELSATKALIFDLRGFPLGTGWPIGARLAAENTRFTVARFRRPAYEGPPKREGDERGWLWINDIQRASTAPRYTGRIFALVDEDTAGQAEYTALIFKAASGVTLVGSQTAGAIGDVTQITLPGGLVARITGHEVRGPKGEQIQRLGLRPDVHATQTLRSLRIGRDDVLERALSIARR